MMALEDFEMRNRDIYLVDPAARKLVNEGVASVNDDTSDRALEVLRYELETFVCEGQYEKGLIHILETFLSNIDQAQQPAVWVSGFYGSGKSHFVKMLRALWDDTCFADGARARGLANLPQSINDLLKELDTEGRRHGGLHAASGTLGAGASGSVRLALLRIIFKSAGLPEQYPHGRFVIWLEKEGIARQVHSFLKEKGSDWEEELDNLYVSHDIHEALIHVRPETFPEASACAEILINTFPDVKDISSDEMLKAIRDALTKEGKFPLTLVALDEVQQYIGEDSQRSIAVQEMVEACSKTFGGKLLFIGTGQTAVSGTSNLKKLEGRFTVRVELSDADVDAVIRQVILRKKAEAHKPIEEVMGRNLGEISRHLAGTGIGHRQEDIPLFPQDYPILPVRRRFWESTLRVMDQTGTDSQLRNQLSLVHRVIQTNLDEDLGHVVPTDYLYFDSADKLLQSSILPRKVHEKTMIWIEGSDDEKLMARACGLVFLINKLGSQNKELGIRATIDSLADLLVEDLPNGSSSLRSKLPALLDNCELLMQVEDEYRIQTEESIAWNDEFRSQCSVLSSGLHRIEAERDDRIRRCFAEQVGRLSLTHGDSKISREIHTVFGHELPANASQRICVWVRDGWNVERNTVHADAMQAGISSPIIFVYIPRRSADDLRHHLIAYKAAVATLEARGLPDPPEGIEAHAAMETIRRTAEGRINELLREALSGARVFQGGGSEVHGSDLREMLLEAGRNALARLYPQFETADHPGWSKVYENARKGAPDALRAVGDLGEPANNPVCRAILGFIGQARKGAEIREHFESSPYGWSGDAVDGALQVLLVTEQIIAHDERGRQIKPDELERRSIGKTLFRVESITISVGQRIEIRKLLQRAGLNSRQGEELRSVPQFMEIMNQLADRAGGEAPKPERPDTRSLDALRRLSGNEQLLGLYSRRDELKGLFESWTVLATRIDRRLPGWELLERLAVHASGLVGAEGYQEQLETIRQQRQLLVEPDPITPLITGLTQQLRDELNRVRETWDELWRAGEARLHLDPNWQKLEAAQRESLRTEQQLTQASVPQIKVDSTESILKTLDNMSLEALHDRLAALPARFGNVLRRAAKLCEPKAQFITLPRRTLETEADIDAWIRDVQQQLRSALESGPVVIL